MSAFVVSKAHIDVMVHVAYKGPRGQAVSPDTAWHRPKWYTADPQETLAEGGWEALQAISREIQPVPGYPGGVTFDELGQMLVCENVLSVRSRYDETEPDASLPGPCDEYWREPYRFERPAYTPTAVEALQAIACLEYQSCEHPEWHGSEAERFCEALRHALISALPGMRQAPWEWTAEKVDEARAAQLGA